MSGNWLEIRERGSLVGSRLLVWIATSLGRPATRFLVSIIVLYYAIFAKEAYRAARSYWQKRGISAGFWQIYRHLRKFAHCTLDRIFILSGKTRGIEFVSHGNELLEKQAQTGRGALLLGAHLGSFEALRYRGGTRALKINIIGDFRNAKMINEILTQISGQSDTRVIHVGTDAVATAFEIERCIAAGEFVAILGDRTGHGPQSEVHFLGTKTSLPTGIYALANTLKCPIYLTFALSTSARRYDLYCEEFALEVTIPRAQRKQLMAQYAQRYAQRLEYYCNKAPDNWFNFYDYWPEESSPQIRLPASADSTH